MSDRPSIRVSASPTVLSPIRVAATLLLLAFLAPAVVRGAGGNIDVADDFFRDTASGSTTTTIHTGETVTWTWTGANPHSATSGPCSAADCTADGLFDSGILRGAHTFTHTFLDPGTFDYFCVVHDPMMHGSIVVEGAPACGTITLTPGSLPGALKDGAYAQTVSASGGTAPYGFAVTTGALPTGLHIDGATGKISGTTTADGAFPFTVTATDSRQCTGAQAYSVTVAEGAPAGESAVIQGVGSLPGAFGAFFRTQLQLNNPGTVILAGKIVYHPGGASAGAGDPSIPYTLGSRQTVNFDDVLAAMGLSGLGSADIVPTSGDAPVAVARIYNDGGDAGTAGFTEPVFHAKDVLKDGDSAVFVLPADPANFRFNLGVRSLGSGLSATFTIFDESGAQTAKVSKSYPASFFVQAKATDFLGVTSLPADGSIEIRITAGSGIFSGSTVDNRTQDTSTQFTGK